MRSWAQRCVECQGKERRICYIQKWMAAAAALLCLWGADASVESFRPWPVTPMAAPAAPEAVPVDIQAQALRALMALEQRLNQVILDEAYDVETFEAVLSEAARCRELVWLSGTADVVWQAVPAATRRALGWRKARQMRARAAEGVVSRSSAARVPRGAV